MLMLAANASGGGSNRVPIIQVNAARVARETTCSQIKGFTDGLIINKGAAKQ